MVSSMSLLDMDGKEQATAVARKQNTFNGGGKVEDTSRGALKTNLFSKADLSLDPFLPSCECS